MMIDGNGKAIIANKIQWFQFQYMMSHAANNLSHNDEHNLLKFMFKVLYIFMVMSQYKQDDINTKLVGV